MAADLTFTIRAPREVEMVPVVDGTLARWREAIKRESRSYLVLMEDWLVNDSPNGTSLDVWVAVGLNFS